MLAVRIMKIMKGTHLTKLIIKSKYNIKFYLKNFNLKIYIENKKEKVIFKKKSNILEMDPAARYFASAFI